MSIRRCIATLVAVFALAPSAALAQTPAAPASSASPTPSTSNRTADYLEQNVAGDQLVKFTGDELAGDPKGAYGLTIRPAPGPVRALLIRPRMNFVVELLKSVENL